MRKLLLALAASLALAGAASARVVPVPPNDPALMVTIPDTWKTEKIEYGYSAVSPGKDVFISVEYARGDDAQTMLTANRDWMKENSIKEVEPTKEEGTVNGVPMTHYEFDTTDEDGKTLVDFFMMRAGHHLAMITIWGSVAERDKHQADLVAFINSVKPTN